MEASPENTQVSSDQRTSPWKMLVVDDDSSVLQVTKLALIGFEYAGQGVELLYAASGAEARRMYEQEQDIAAILLDVVMETDDAGLIFADYVRREMNDQYVRIILRTGQAGRMSVPDVMRDYDVNDFCEKVDLTADRMFVVLYTALRDRDFLVRQDQLRAELDASVTQLQASNEKLEVFAYMAGHDLQAPLRKISWRVRRATEAVTSDAPRDDILREIEAVERNCYYLSGLLESLLKYAHLKNVPMEMTSVAVDDILRNVLSNLESDLRACQGSVTLPKTTLSVVGDLNLLTTLFQNLISNALKFCRPNMLPMVSVTCSQQAHPDTGRPMVALAVTDQGTGIEPTALQSIFEPFRRAANTQHYEGSGLGLSIARQVAMELGGDIFVSSEEGKGSTFTVLLPEVTASGR